MLLLLLWVGAAAALGVPCPRQCDCGTGDELDYFCRLDQSHITLTGRTNEYVNIKCSGSSFPCSELPVINFANNLTLPSLGVTGCPPSILNCVNHALQANGVSSIVLINMTEGLEEQHVEGLGDLQSIMIMKGAERAIPSSAISALPSLKTLRISGTPIELHPNDFSPLPPLHYLELSSDKITEIPDNSFHGLSKLMILNIWGNNFRELKETALNGLDSLESLTLSTNNLFRITVGAFSHVPKLKVITLVGNQLEVLPAGLLYNLILLENVTIQSNLIPLILQPHSLSNLPSLKMVNLEYSRINSLPEDLLAGNYALQYLSVAHNAIASLPVYLFKDLKSLERLDLSFNKIEALSNAVFAPLKSLKYLNMNRNYLEVLPDTLFSGLKNLEYVSIDHNHLTAISPTAFQGATGLQTVSLIANKLTLKSDDHEYSDLELYSPFASLERLKKLYLNGNNINTIFEDWKIALLNLEELNLSWNDFTFLTGTDCQFLSDKIVVDLQHNNVTSIILSYALINSSESVKSSKSSIILDNNPLDCDCGLYNLAMRLRGATPISTEPKFVLNNARCASPKTLKGKLFKNVSPKFLNCDLPKENCFNSCFKCEMRPALNDVYYECLNIPPVIPNVLDFGVNSISLKLDRTPSNLGNWNLRLLNLSGIELVEIPFEPSKTVKIIDFSNNNLTRIPVEFLNGNTSLFLSRNQFECHCWNADDISFFQKSVLVLDRDYVTCDDGRNMLDVDVVSLCSDWRAAAVASGTFIALVLLVAIAILAVYKYSNEIELFIISNKLLPWIYVQDPNDINKKNDVFISFAHKDKIYVDEMLPKLENEFGFNTCVHYRDWVAGDYIPDQINRSVENSRKTIILLSNNYLESDYANMEFRSAYDLALKEGKSRVIIVLLEDVSKHPKLSEEMKAYMLTNTYLKWGEQKFWEKLHRALSRYSLRHNKKFPKIFRNTKNTSTVKTGLDVHLNSDGKLVNVAYKDAV